MVNPSEPLDTCWFYHPSGCPIASWIGVGQWTIDEWGPQNGFVGEAGCQVRVGGHRAWCGTYDITYHYIHPPPVCTPPAPAPPLPPLLPPLPPHPPPSPRLPPSPMSPPSPPFIPSPPSVAPAPDEPDTCWHWFPTGCATDNFAPPSTAWTRDSWGPANGFTGYAGCEQRVVLYNRT